MVSTYIAPPTRKRIILIFDVETTGLLPKKTKGVDVIPIDQYPYILQLSFALYDIYNRNIIRSYDSYVRIPEHIEISEYVTNLTGINKEICQTKGNSIINVLSQFYDAYMICEGLVAHNIDFDKKMISIEIERNRELIMKTAPYCSTIFNPVYQKIKNIEEYCTMKYGTDVADMKNESGLKKWPRLIELYGKLFDGEIPKGLHNSMNDVLACLRCYLKMRHGINQTIII